eukprot:Transcript_24725.p1 GENE.Transcript_24725~~Transcript_24725.p1  ORF type:complete len:548 (-),score=116.38 Transcript_24725:478-2121(-)
MALLLLGLVWSKDETPSQPTRWTAFRVVEKALSGTGQVVRGVGDAIAVGAGGAIRVVGDSVESVGSGIEDVGHVVAGDSSDAAELSASDATRRLVSKPIRLLSQAVRSAGQMVNMVGDTTEKIAGGAFSIVPDTVQVVASSVRTLGDALDPDSKAEAEASARGSSANAKEGGGAPTPEDLEQGIAAPSSTASASDAPPPTNTGLRDASVLQRWRGWADAEGAPLASPHAALALLAAVALGPQLGRGGQALLLALLLLYFQSMAAQHNTMQRQRLEVETQRQLAMGRQLAGRHESLAWLNSLLASGWDLTIAPLLQRAICDEIAATLQELPLPRSLRAVHLSHLELGAQPPLLLAAACAPLPRGAPFERAGCEAQLSLIWEVEAAFATLTFLPANVASQPRLRFARPRLRGTLHVQWEWLPFPANPYPYVGRVRLCFVGPPEAHASIEPLGSLDVTQLPGLGHWLRFVLKDSINAVATHPNWLETDMRLSSRDIAPATPAYTAEDEDDDGAGASDLPPASQAVAVTGLPRAASPRTAQTSIVDTAPER